jgi:methylthioribose-1-phosphate isomerase
MDMRGVEAIVPVFDGGSLVALDLIDQRVLPRETRWIRCLDAADAASAITAMVVRGAPAIAITAAWGLALQVVSGGDRAQGVAVLAASRPTAVNLRWALERLAAVPDGELVAAARAVHAEDVAINRALGEVGAALLPDRCSVVHHCNTGALATGGWGTALGVVRSAHAAGKAVHVWVSETRPYLQGARLTAWELAQEGISATLVVDSAVASLMAAGRVDAVLVGCDRVAANGDTANKIGTLSHAVSARHYGVPFYVAMPTSTLDLRCPTGAGIVVEERGAAEVRGHAGAVWAADIPVFNPAFDVTPAELVTAWVTENGLWRPPSVAERGAAR